MRRFVPSRQSELAASAELWRRVTCAIELFRVIALGDLTLTVVLLRQVTSIECRNKDGCTPYLLACSLGHEDMVALMVQRGAKRDALSNNLNTALHLACLQGHKDVARMLIRLG